MVSTEPAAGQMLTLTSKQVLNEDDPPVIEESFLLVTFLSYYIDEFGGVWIDRLWHKDLVQHLVYIENLSVLAPRQFALNLTDPIRMRESDAQRIKFIALPIVVSLASFLMALPRMFSISWKAVGRATIVQSSVIGWPLPLGWVVNPIALLRKKLLFIVVESAFWRITDAKIPTWKHKIRAPITEYLASYFVNRADLTLYTQESYRSTLATNARGKSIVVPASWIDEEDIIELDKINSRVEPASPFRFFCPSRLNVEKGIGVLLDALRLLDDAKVECDVVIMGSGELKPECNQIARMMRSIRVLVLDPVAYGEPFFRCIRDSDCVIVPIISDEQPRIVFDAFSQGCPVIASDTDGLRPYIQNDVTGWLVQANKADLLAGAMREVMKQSGRLLQMRIAARNVAVNVTHQLTHRKRWSALAALTKE